MSPALLRRISPIIACLGIALGGGLLGGATAVHGLRLNSYGDAPPVKASAIASTDADVISTDPNCVYCSERALGFRWATVRGINSSADCPNDSWNFRRGCADYVNGRSS